MSRPKPISQMSVAECYAEISGLEKTVETETAAVKRHIEHLRNQLINGDLGIFLTTKSQELAGAKEVLAILPERLKPLSIRINEARLRILEIEHKDTN